MEEEKVNVRDLAFKFAQFYRECRDSQSVFIVAGPKNVGKSVTIDLLADKKITQQEEEGHEGTFLVQEVNY